MKDPALTWFCIGWACRAVVYWVGVWIDKRSKRGGRSSAEMRKEHWRVKRNDDGKGK